MVYLCVCASACLILCFDLLVDFELAVCLVVAVCYFVRRGCWGCVGLRLLFWLWLCVWGLRWCNYWFVI